MRSRVAQALIPLALVAIGCGGISDSPSASQTAINAPPEWARSAVWYQVFVERFSNGDPSNDPTLRDIQGSWPHVQPDGWTVKPWTSDWYGQDDWESAVADDFYYSVQLRRYGGDLQGVIDRLDHIESLGVTAIYLNPINDSPSLHKYDARNYRHVDRNFGPDPAGDEAVMAREDPVDPSTWQWTSADSLFLELIREVHARDMRIIVDYSWNHTGMTFWAFRDVVQNQRDSRFADWYQIRSFDDPDTPENEFAYEGWAGVAELPSFSRTVPDDDYERRPLEGDLHPGPKQLAFDVSARWLDPNGDGDPSDGVDGFRLDVAEMVPLGFWRDYRKHVRGINPEALLVGEVWWEHWPEQMLDPTPWLGDVFDSVMNYRWYMPTRSVVTGALPRVAPSQYRAHLDSVEAGLPRATLEAMMNVAATHDAPRLSTSLQNRGRYKNQVMYRDNPDLDYGRPDEATVALQQALLMLQYTYYGAPHIWAGDELGMWGGDDPDNRKPLWWPDMTFDAESPPGSAHADVRAGRASATAVAANESMLSFYKELGELRMTHREALSHGVLDMLFATDTRPALGLRRAAESDTVWTVVNLSGEPLDVDLGTHGAVKPEVHVGSNAWSLDGTRLLLGPRSGVVMTGH